MFLYITPSFDLPYVDSRTFVHVNPPPKRGREIEVNRVVWKRKKPREKNLKISMRNKVGKFFFEIKIDPLEIYKLLHFHGGTP
jgi:hypothetical protein